MGRARECCLYSGAQKKKLGPFSLPSQKPPNVVKVTETHIICIASYGLPLKAAAVAVAVYVL